MLACDAFAEMTTLCVLLLLETGRLRIGHLYAINALYYSQIEWIDEAKKGFGDEIPKQVWAAAQRSLYGAGAI